LLLFHGRLGRQAVAAPENVVVPKPEHLIAGAIAFSGALVALAVHQGFRGLAERMVEAAPRPGVIQASQANTGPPSAPGLAAPQAAAPADPVSAQKQAELWAQDRELRIEEQVRSALAAQQQKYMTECFEVPGGAPEPKGPANMGRYELAFEFDAEGKEVRRTFTAKAEHNPAREACVKKLEMPKIKIDPLGESRTVKVDFSLP